MAITSSKRSRRIVVDGVTYRWLVIRSRPTCGQSLGAPLSFAVEQEGQGGCVLLVATDAVRPDNWLQLPRAIITPALVAQTIRQAKRAGWEPGAKGGNHKFHLSINDSTV